ncbi:hypothetical protein WL21_04640 [Burkholderia ubonensis]|uniref:hypothetical protein n=1 Tax=Burkholderia ubonensis TaxID=101571 RepID=UPI00075C88D6|nr:hypothetical protein [Burkholderia ubonensis]KVO87675.1 hypothetical protein WJ81_15610 [Burkholderia ubonensis]KVZ57292.1 hypothetical protein WL20_23395 [Burkholderia ubonensis]KVZ72989.1 hypothetical protein WL21_04640 [Burkholderia ubonensis]
MSMQPNTAGIGRAGEVWTGRSAGVTRGAPAGAPLAAAAVSADAQRGSPARAAFTARQHALNQTATAAQRTLAFLDTALPQLREIDGTLSAGVSDSRLGARIERFAAHWETRVAATGGALDVGLRFDAAGGARRRFAVRALDAAQWAAGGAETVTFHPQGPGRRAASVSFDGTPLTPEALVQRLDRALGPAGMRVERDAAGALWFSVSESNWAAVRDRLAIEGGGKRFPGGRPSRVAVDEAPATIDPRRWRAGDRMARRDAARAIEVLQRARRDVEQVLRTAGQAMREHGLDKEDAGGAARAFADAIGPQRGFDAVTVAAVAVKGISRERVVAVVG